MTETPVTFTKIHSPGVAMQFRNKALCCLLSLFTLDAFGEDVLTPYSFDEAVSHGVIDYVVNPWAHPDVAPDIDAIAKLNPGFVNRLGFEYGGVVPQWLNFSGDAATKLHRVLPRARIGGGFPENLKADYKAALPCDTEDDVRTFTRLGLTGKPFDTTNAYYWMDLGLVPTQQYYICLGKSLIRRNFNHLHFEESDNILLHCASRSACVEGYKHVLGELQGYAREKRVQISFSGEPDLAQQMPLDSVYIPARFYIDDFDREYRNKIPTGIGKGYTYALSAKIVQDTLKKVPARTHVFFYVDNFDSRQDDLRRLMELDRPNRQELILRSSAIARQYGATFIPSFNHCDGCIPNQLVGDSCELLADGKPSTYNARACGDLDAIRESFVDHRSERREIR